MKYGSSPYSACVSSYQKISIFGQTGKRLRRIGANAGFSYIEAAWQR
jgi:hypothetical protein